MDITIVGSGNIGGGLARAWASKGHRIVFATRTPDDLDLLPLLSATGARAQDLASAVNAAQIVVLALPYGAVAEVAALLPDWQGRIVIDCTNAIGPGGKLLVGHNDSGAETNARLLKGSRLVKSFNAQGAENLAQPVYGSVPATNFYCGDDAQAKDIVRQLIADVGFEPVDLGALAAARFLEPMTLLWFAATRATGSRSIAFKLLRH
jgi:8-hydroxy-5-deazaflavin:NADPH oxidoreductase